jgi:hypothetical protein
LDFVAGVNSAGTGFGRYVGYTADLAGFNGEMRQVEVERYLYTFEQVIGFAVRDPETTANLAMEAVKHADAHYLAGRAIVGPSTGALINKVTGGNPAAGLIGSGVASAALFGDMMHAIETGYVSHKDVIQTGVLGFVPDGVCSASY